MAQDAKPRENRTRNDPETRDERANGSDEARNPKLASGSDDAPTGNAIKDPEDWVTGDEEPTAAQLSYLHTLSEEAGEEVPEGLTKAQASERIDALKEKTGRGG